MAASRPEPPNVAALARDQSRSHVILIMGEPQKTVVNENGRVDFFQYEADDPERINALSHAIMDVLTVGLWEIHATPMEATATPKLKSVYVQYNPNDFVVAISNAPLASVPTHGLESLGLTVPPSRHPAQR